MASHIKYMAFNIGQRSKFIKSWKVWLKMYQKINLRSCTQKSQKNQIRLVKQRRIYLYKYMDSLQKNNNLLKDGNIDGKDYKHVKRVRNELEVNTVRYY